MLSGTNDQVTIFLLGPSTVIQNAKFGCKHQTYSSKPVTKELITLTYALHISGLIKSPFLKDREDFSQQEKDGRHKFVFLSVLRERGDEGSEEIEKCCRDWIEPLRTLKPCQDGPIGTRAQSNVTAEIRHIFIL